MERINRIGLHGFILATAVAMFIHSTWTFNTIFGGQQPTDGNIIQYIMWVIPGALIAFAIDIGQIATSMKIRQARSWNIVGLGITFLVLAAGGYYLQWFHLIHHMPKLAFGEGLSEATRLSVLTARDAAIYIIPALMPLSMFLYTLSNIGESVPVKSEAIEAAPLVSRLSNFPTLWTRRPQPNDAALPSPVPVHKNGTAKIAEGSYPESLHSGEDFAEPDAE
jgi:hypothetical protein